MRRIKFLSLLAALLCSISLSAQSTPKYIFYYIGDGMGFGAVSLARAYNSMVLNSDTLITMMQFPVASIVTTHSASSGVTDSAAAGTALATGVKTKNGMLGMDADSVAVTSIATQLKAKGYGIGLVTTVAPDDATPGAFYAHVPNRGMFYEIGCQAATSGFDFIAGANLRGLRDKNTGDTTDLLEVFERNGVSVVRGIEAVSSAPHSKILMLNTSTEYDNEVGLRIDSLPGVLTLPAMTRTCLDFLKAKSPDAFFMMVEGGSIDHAAHANDAATLIHEMDGFDKALAIAFDFYKQHPDETLIIVTADHETGGLGIGNRTISYRIEPQYLQYPSISKDRFVEYGKALLRSRSIIEWEDIKKYLTEEIGLYESIPVSDNDNEAIKDSFEKMLTLRAEGDMEGAYTAAGKFVDAVFGAVSHVSGIDWTTNAHTGAMVPVFAVGVGAEYFSPMHDNTQLPALIRQFTGITE